MTVTLSDLEEAKRADLARMVKAAQDGRPLSARERELIDEEIARQKAEAGSGPSQKELGLEGAGAGSRKPPGKTWADLASEFGISERAAKYWEQRGLAKGDPCPWDEPERIPIWYPRHHRGTTLAAAVWERIRAMGKGDENRAPGADFDQSSIPDEGRAAPNVVEVEGRLAKIADRLTQEADRIEKNLDDARLRKDAMAERAAREELLAVGERLRQLDKAVKQDAISQGIFVRRSEVEAELVELHQAVRAAVRHEFRQAEAKLRETLGSAAWAMAVDETATRIDQHLSGCTFASEA